MEINSTRTDRNKCVVEYIHSKFLVLKFLVYLNGTLVLLNIYFICKFEENVAG